MEIKKLISSIKYRRGVIKSRRLHEYFVKQLYNATKIPYSRFK